MRTKKNFRQGRFLPKNLEKYKGNSRNVIYRSSWEKRIMAFFDESTNIEWWNSEGLIVPYMNPIDKKMHSYYPDFVFMNKKNDVYMVEVKPFNDVLIEFDVSMLNNTNFTQIFLQLPNILQESGEPDSDFILDIFKIKTKTLDNQVDTLVNSVCK